jgi:hypothetical protein
MSQFLRICCPGGTQGGHDRTWISLSCHLLIYHDISGGASHSQKIPAVPFSTTKEQQSAKASGNVGACVSTASEMNTIAGQRKRQQLWVKQAAKHTVAILKMFGGCERNAIKSRQSQRRSRNQIQSIGAVIQDILF